MGAIDIGPGAINREYDYGYNDTLIDKTNPSNGTGTLTSVEFWFLADAAGVKVGTFSGSDTSYDDRDYETIGAVTAGSKQTFSGLNCDVVSGDFLGVFYSSGTIEMAYPGGVALYAYTGDAFGKGVLTYTYKDPCMISIYGTGATAEVRVPFRSFYPHIVAH